ncbi:MAG: hypothetical protein LBH49_02720 [Puniceicoccales bacterium]|jgi:hypothetical protein|nr:hypothetical protein [Puniceicoccales bacterium]
MKSSNGSALIECILGISIFALSVTMLSQSFITGMVIKKRSRGANSNDMANTMFIINSVLKKGYDIATSATGESPVEVALPSWDGTSAKGSIKILKKTQIKGKCLASANNASSGNASLQEKNIEGLWKLEIAVKPGENSEEKTYEIYRYLPKPTATGPAETTAAGKSTDQAAKPTN